VAEKNLDGSTWVMILVQIESSDINEIFKAMHHSIEHDFRKIYKTFFIIFRAKTNFL
jgi:hypothetical protein